MTIVVCEPQCCGFEHAQFNAALLATVLLAFPEARVVFLGETSHVVLVEEALAEHAGPAPRRLSFRALPLSPPDPSHWGRVTLAGYRRERAWARPLRTTMTTEGADLLILASASNTGLLAWKASSRFRPATPTLAILHAVLATLGAGPRFALPVLAQRPRWWRDARGIAVRLRLGPILSHVLTRTASLRRIALLPPRTLRCVVLGPSVHRALAGADPALAARVDAMDLPCFMPDDVADAPAPPPVVRFGFFGVGYKGFARFADLARTLRPRHAHARFELVGFLNTPELPSSYEGFVDGVGSRALPRAEFERRARATTYAVWTADPARYRLSASASFVDALRFGKPGIYLRNAYVEHYFERFGDIGYLCDSLDQARDVAESVLRDFPIERYRAQQQAIQAGRGVFAPEAQAVRLRAAFGALRAAIER